MIYSENTNPLVTIWIPVYNGADFIWRALESATNQTYKNLEILVFDDASKDNTGEIVQGYKDKDSRINYIKTEKNLGYTKSMTQIFRLAKGKYVQHCAHDDWLSRNYIEECVKIFEREEGVSSVLGRIFSIVSKDNSYYFTREAEVKSGIYPKKYFGDNAYRTFIPSMIMLGMANKEDALNAMLAVESFLNAPPPNLPEPLREMIQHEYGSDVIYPIKLAAKESRFIVAQNAVYLKTELPIEHYMTHKGSMKLREKYGINNDTARGILKRYGYRRMLYDNFFFRDWKSYVSKMRIFFGKEALATIFAEAIKRRLDGSFLKVSLKQDVSGLLFADYSFYEKFMSVACALPRVIKRFFDWVIRSFFRKQNPDIYSKNFFLDKQGRFVV
ncbi:MAG: glycosyltransferase family 2 protein [Candidatus Liptonbacteria bacterium]|nr:glycosyltransferase family 2 protein [Candidatus Liptonbacteria bacterium]